MPPPPDPAATAAAQGQANKDAAVAQAQINMVNQQTPYGSLSYSQRGTGPDGTPLYTATTTLSPGQQRLYDSGLAVDQGVTDLARGYIGRIGDATAKPFDMADFGASPQYSEADRVAARDRIVARAQPLFDQQREGIEGRLLAQGVTQGSEAYNRGVDELRRSQNDYYLGADVQAGAEAGQTYDRSVAERQRAVQEALLQRQTPINEVSALLGTSQGVQQPQFVNTPQTGMQPADVLGAQQLAYQGQLANFNAQNQRYNANLQGLYSLAGAGIRMGAGRF